MLIHNALITGSLSVNGTGYNTGSFSGSFIGAVAGTTATASYVEYNSVANKPALVSGSSQVTYSGLTGIPSGIVSGSSQVSEFGIFATTGSNGFNGSQSITGSLTVTGQVVAQTLNVQQVISSVVYSSGSNIFGNSLSNTQQLTGSVSVTGSLATSGTGTFSGALSLNSSANRVNSGNELRFYRTDNGIYTQLYDGGAANGFVLDNRNGDGFSFQTAGTNQLRIASTGAATFLGPTVTIGNAVSATNVKLILNGVASKAAGIEFHQSGTPQWYIGNGIASEDNNFELYNSNGTMAMKIIKSTNAINFIGAATFSSTIRSDATNGFSIGSVAGHRRIQYVSANTTFSLLNDSNALANFEAAAATFSSSVTATGGTEIPNGQFYRARRSSSNLLIDLLGIESGTDNTRLLITGDFNIKNGSLQTLLTVNTVGLASFSNNITINNGQFYQAKRNTAGSIINVLGFESGTDDLIQVTSNSFKLRNTGTGDAANMMTVSQAGAAVFSSSVTTTFLRITDSAGQIGEISSTNANGGYITWGTSGTTIADLGTAQQIFGSGGNDTFGINGRGARALTFGTNNTQRLRITSGGDIIKATHSGYDGTYDNLIKYMANGDIGVNNNRWIGVDATVTAGGASANAMRFRVYQGSAAQDQPPLTVMTLLGDGNVGIGTTSPTKRLQVEASVAGEVAQINNTRNSASGDYALVTLLGTNCNNTNNYHYIAATGGADRMYVYGNGNVVNTNGSYGTLSDISLKENIVDATPKLADLLQLKVRNFNLIGSEEKQIGFVAQEFEEIFPKMVDIDGKNGMKTIKTSVLVPMLVKAIQELKAELDAAKAEIQLLKQQ